MSGTLAPSKSTIYVSNLPFSLTNNDLHKIFERHGKVVKVTILSDKQTRKSKGVAFVLFLDRDSAHTAVHALNNTELFGRVIKCSIAKDNGRAPEFIRRREYKDKSKCYECGGTDHLSYNCPKNVLGDREPPPKKERKRKKDTEEADDKWHEDEDEGEISEEGEDLTADSLAAAIKFQQEKEEVEDYQYRVATGEYASTSKDEPQRKKYKTDGYFSDEEELDT